MSRPRGVGCVRPGWQGYGPRPGRFYEYGETGWVVAHCGHPTAIRPYYVLDPEERIHYHPVTNQGFILLADAQGYVEAQVAPKGAENDGSGSTGVTGQ